MYAIILNGLPLCRYANNFLGWGYVSSLDGSPGNVVLFDSIELANEKIESNRVFFVGADIVFLEDLQCLKVI